MGWADGGARRSAALRPAATERSSLINTMAAGFGLRRALCALATASVARGTTSVGLLNLRLTPRCALEPRYLQRALGAVRSRLYVRLVGEWEAAGWELCTHRLRAVYDEAARAAALGAAPGSAHAPEVRVLLPGPAFDGAGGAVELEAVLCCEGAADEHARGAEAAVEALNDARAALGLGAVRRVVLPAAEDNADAALPAEPEPAAPARPGARLRVHAHSTVCVGGTWDRLHSGHRLLLSAAALAAREHLIVGVSDAALLRSKLLPELIQPLGARCLAVGQFVRALAPALRLSVCALHDVAGPAAELAEIGALVVSEETAEGARAVNALRAQRSLPPLQLLHVPLVAHTRPHAHLHRPHPAAPSAPRPQRAQRRGAALPPSESAHPPGAAAAAGVDVGAAAAAAAAASAELKLSSTHLRRAQLAALLPASPLAAAAPRCPGEAAPDAAPAAVPGAEAGARGAWAEEEEAWAEEAEWGRRSAPGTPYIVGLTGGIASGKSTAARAAAALGARTVDCDALGHRAYARGSEGLRAVVARFGEGVLGADGSIDRRALGQIVFSQPGARQALNAIMWPRIAQLARAEAAEGAPRAAAPGAAGPVVLVEAAVLLEAGWDAWVDEVWAVGASRPLALARIRERDGLSASAAEARIDAQLGAGQRAARSHVLLSSEWGAAELAAQVARALDGARARAARSAAPPAPGSARHAWHALCAQLRAPPAAARAHWRLLHDAHAARGAAHACATHAELTLARLRPLLAMARAEGAALGLGAADRACVELALLFAHAHARPRALGGSRAGYAAAAAALAEFGADAGLAAARGGAAAHGAAVVAGAARVLDALGAGGAPARAAPPATPPAAPSPPSSAALCLAADLELAPLAWGGARYFGLADGAEVEACLREDGAGEGGAGAGDGADDAACCAGVHARRLQVVSALLRRPRLYRCDSLHARLDAHARTNLRAELYRLAGLAEPTPPGAEAR